MSTGIKTKADIAPGKRIPGNRKGIRKEVNEILYRRFNEGIFHVHFGAGRFVNHMVPSIMEPVSFCGRFVGNTSTSMLTTPIGKVCGECIKLHKTAFVEWMDGKAKTISSNDTEKLKAIGNIRAAMEEHPNDWHPTFAGYEK